MRRILSLSALCILALSPRLASAQSRQQGATRDMRDTLPVRVVQRMTDAYNRRDAPGLFAEIDTLFFHDQLSDTTHTRHGTPEQIYGWFADSAKTSPNLGRIDVVRRIEHGPFVVQLYDMVLNGKRTPRLDIFEVRHGKVVHEWEQ